jgi:hypothetical protein
MTITRKDILLAYDCVNWFFKNRPDNTSKKAEGYKYNKHHLAIPFYTMPFDIADRRQFSDYKSGVNGFTATYNDMFIVALDSSDNARDWKSNFGYRQKVMPYAESASSKVRMHGAYAEGWMRVRNDVHQAFIESHCKSVLVCGYSMGGGVAPICALDFQYTFEIPSDMIKCVIGDGPRVFNKAGMESYNRRVPNTIRLKWGNDIVTKLPPPFFGFWHVGKELHLGPTERWWKMSLLDHDPARGEYNSIVYRLEDGPIDESWLKIHR